MCGGLILSCCPRNPHGHERALKEEEELLGPLLRYTISMINRRDTFRISGILHFVL